MKADAKTTVLVWHHHPAGRRWQLTDLAGERALAYVKPLPSGRKWQGTIVYRWIPRTVQPTFLPVFSDYPAYAKQRIEEWLAARCFAIWGTDSLTFLTWDEEEET